MNNPDYEARYRKATGELFARLRNEHNWSLREFAERVGGVAHTSLYAVERGESTPSIDVLGRVAACFGLSLGDILLLIVNNLDPEPSNLGDFVSQYQQMSTSQRHEVEQFFGYIRYRDALA